MVDHIIISSIDQIEHTIRVQNQIHLMMKGVCPNDVTSKSECRRDKARCAGENHSHCDPSFRAVIMNYLE